METRVLHIRLETEHMESLQKIAEACEVTPTALGGFLIRAALRAIGKSNQRLKLPPDFILNSGEAVRGEQATTRTAGRR